MFSKKDNYQRYFLVESSSSFVSRKSPLSTSVSVYIYHQKSLVLTITQAGLLDVRFPHQIYYQTVDVTWQPRKPHSPSMSELDCIRDYRFLRIVPSEFLPYLSLLSPPVSRQTPTSLGCHLPWDRPSAPSRSHPPCQNNRPRASVHPPSPPRCPRVPSYR